MSGEKPQGYATQERGNSLFLVVVSLFVLLGFSALAIDLAMLYVTYSEAQRAADAAALAGAKKFIESGYVSGLISQAVAETLARQEAIAVGAENHVRGEAALILVNDITFDFSSRQNPTITVLVQRAGARGNAVPTFFVKVVGLETANISAIATAEAYTPSGSENVPIGTACVKPWILPNCDPVHGNPDTCSLPFVLESDGSIVNPGSYASGGVIGMPLVLKPGSPRDAAAPSQFYPIQIPPNTEPTLCPDCTGMDTGSNGPGAALYRHNIECCNTTKVVCGTRVPVNLQVGNVVGPTRLGVECLIHEGPGGFGQDILDTSTLPFTIEGGSNNPNPQLQGQLISNSDSIITVPLYDGSPLTPGVGNVPFVTVIGFLQIFLNNVDRGAQGTVNGTILNVAGCGDTPGTPTGSTGAITDSGGSLFPVRLIRPTG